jgi:hypothetical protein
VLGHQDGAGYLTPGESRTCPASERRGQADTKVGDVDGSLGRYLSDAMNVPHASVLKASVPASRLVVSRMAGLKPGGHPLERRDVDEEVSLRRVVPGQDAVLSCQATGDPFGHLLG